MDDLIEAGAKLRSAVRGLDLAQAILVDSEGCVAEALRIAHQTLDEINQLGAAPAAEHNIDDVLRWARGVAAYELPLRMVKQRIHEQGQLVLTTIEIAQGIIASVGSDKIAKLGEAVAHLEEAKVICGGLVEADRMLPIIAETTAYRIGQATGAIGEVLAMLPGGGGD